MMTMRGDENVSLYVYAITESSFEEPQRSRMPSSSPCSGQRPFQTDYTRPNTISISTLEKAPPKSLRCSAPPSKPQTAIVITENDHDNPQATPTRSLRPTRPLEDAKLSPPKRPDRQLRTQYKQLSFRSSHAFQLTSSKLLC